MLKRLLFVWLLGFVAFFAQAQPDCGGPPQDVPPAENCQDICIYCNFNLYMGNNSGYAGDGAPPGFCGTIQNDMWLGFIAGAASATFTVTPSNCTNNDGVQVALYEVCNTAPLGCNGGCMGCGSTPTTIAVTMVVGTNYFLLIDGFGGDQCDLTISVSPPAAVAAPPVGGISPIQGPATVCPGATVNYMVPSVTGAGAYTWTSPTPGVTFNGEFPPAVFDAPEGRIVAVTFPTNVTGNVQICVKADNSCNQGPQICRTINVQPIPPTAFPKATVCFEDAPYTLPWGDEANTVGDKLYKTTLTSYLGCDSVVQQQVLIKPALGTNIGTKYICEGGSINVCGNVIMDGGPIQEVCQSFQGCDSTVTGTVVILAPVADILGGGTLSCITDSILLNSAGSPNGSIKIWRKPPAVVGNGDKYTVTTPGTYVLSTTMTLGGVSCAKHDTIVIPGNTTPPLAGATTNGFIGCGASTATVSGTSNVPNSSYAWGPPLNSSLQTVAVGAAGTYTVTVTSNVNGCTATASTIVTGNTTPPTVTTTGGTLTCAITTIGIGATSSAPNSTYSWVGPNTFTSNLPNPNVTAAGTYTVTVTNPANNCTTTATATVVLNNTPPTASTTVDGVISCPTPVQSIGTNTNAVGPTYQWGPLPFTSTSANPSVNTAGTYTVTITATGGNGCTATASATVTGNTIPPDATAVGDTVTCGTTSITLDGGSTTPDVTYAWTGPNFTANIPDPAATAPGVYTLTVTATNNCTTTATATVDGDFVPPANVTAAGGTITCGATSAPLTSSSTTAPVTFQWSGPGGFNPTTDTATAFNTGIYTIVVTSLNGCTASATAEVVQDANVPDATATGGTLNCINNSIIIDGGSATPGVTLAWTGPNGFSSSAEDPLVALNGTYTLTVTNPLNGCSKLAQANVQIDTISPGASALAGTLTCANLTQALMGSSPTVSVTWSWAGPDPTFPSIQQNPTVSTDGFYTLTVSATGNGCTSTATTEMLVDKTDPVASSTTGTLTCTVTSLIVNGSSTLPATFKWTGPGGFMSTLNAPTVTLPGNYTLEVTAANGCTGTVTVPVAQDIAAPGAAATGGTISCTFPQIGIGASSLTPGVTYVWEGPAPFMSPEQNPTVSVGGTYTVTVTNLGNGCVSTASTTVPLDVEAPTLAAVSPDTLTCAALSVDVQTTATNGTSPVTTFAWIGPGFTSNLEDPTVTAPGVYALTATSANGCQSTTTVAVAENKISPNATASSGTLTCFNPAIKFDGGSTTPGVTYAWAGPGFTSAEEDPTLSVPGVYTLTVTGKNGCTSTATTDLLQNIAPPGATTLSSNTLDCDDLSSTLTGGPATDVTYLWDGPNGFIKTGSIQTVTVPGIYTLTTQSTINGCTSVSSLDLTQDIAPPGAAATGGTISCTFPQISIGSTSPTGTVTYAWKGPGTFTSPQQNPTVSVDGTYTVTITSTSNGCVSTATTTVAKDTEAPKLTAVSPDILTCAALSVGIQATATNATSPVTTFAWAGPVSFTSNLEDPTVTAPGVYTLTATSANGCTTTTTVAVVENKIPPTATATSGTITCFSPAIKFNGGSTTPGATYQWDGPNGFTSIEEDPTLSVPGVYTLTVTGLNGCTTTVTTTLGINTTPPGATTLSSNNLDCDDLASILTGGPATDVTYRWIGPNFDKTGSTQTIMVPGIYVLTTTSTINGCTSTSSVEVTQDIIKPGATALGDTLNCISGMATLTGNSLTAGVTYKWAGPGGYTSPLPSPNNVTNPGLYTLTVTGLNGCTSTATATVAQNNGTPIVTLTNPVTLTCAVDTISVTATISTPGATGIWTGPANFTSVSPTIQIDVPGIYVYTVVNPVNGCKTTPSVDVKQDIQAPQNVTATGGEIDCITPTISIQGSTTTPNVDYKWTGPLNYTSNFASPNDITNPGTYTLVVTNKANGCTDSATAVVTSDPTVPEIAVTTEVITCKKPSVTLQATTNNPSGVTWDWSGPGITPPDKTVEDPTVTLPGNYTVVVKAISSGCTATFTIPVIQDKVAPGATAAGDTLTCLVSSIVINSSSSTAGVEYKWAGPSGFGSPLQNPTVTLVGTYTVTVTGQNGCTSTATAVVSPDKDAPVITAQGGTVTCSILSIQLKATANVAVQWLWSGPGNFSSTEQNPTITQAGDYTVQATAANGCSVSTVAVVIANTGLPAISLAVPKELNCTTVQVGLSATVPGAGPFTYAWATANGNIVSGGTSPAPTVSQAGLYVLTVTNTSNGCTSTAQVTVLTDPATPSGVASLKRDVLCFGDTNGTVQIDSVQGGTPPFLFSLDNKPFSAATSFASLPPGPHILTVQDANGCEFETTINIFEPEKLLVDLGRDTTIHLGDFILLDTSNIVNFPDRVDQLLVKPAEYVKGDTLFPIHSFRYTATAIDTNGCKATDDRVVIVDKTRLVFIPNVLYPESANGNELLRISVGQDVEIIRAFQIYDRWGAAVYEKRNFLPETPSNDGWDGRVKGDRATPAVFVYYAEILFKDGEVEIFKGDITLYR